MNQRFGVARGQSPGDACAVYALFALGGRFPDGTVWRPDPFDDEACLRQVERDEHSGGWLLRYSWRVPEPAAAAGS